MSMDAVGTKANNILLSCNMLYFHFCWGLFMILIGAVAIVSRIAVKPLRKWLRPWHATLGQAWMYGMIVQISTSLYCRQDGFRPFIYGFLVICVANMIIAHLTIRAFQRGVQRAKLAAVVASQSASQFEPCQEDQSSTPILPDGELDLANIRVAGVSLTCLKRIHGFCMCLSYSMLFGAGVMFSTRSKQLRNCHPFVAVPNILDGPMPVLIWQRDDGDVVMGGRNCPTVGWN